MPDLQALLLEYVVNVMSLRIVQVHIRKYVILFFSLSPTLGILT